MLRAQDSRMNVSGTGKGRRTKVGPFLHPHNLCPSSSPNIQTLYSGLSGWRVGSLITGEQEP